jgi:hypothetical protein
MVTNLALLGHCDDLIQRGRRGLGHQSFLARRHSSPSLRLIVDAAVGLAVVAGPSLPGTTGFAFPKPFQKFEQSPKPAPGLASSVLLGINGHTYLLDGCHRDVRFWKTHPSNATFGVYVRCLTDEPRETIRGTSCERRFGFV